MGRNSGLIKCDSNVRRMSYSFHSHSWCSGFSSDYLGAKQLVPTLASISSFDQAVEPESEPVPVLQEWRTIRGRVIYPRNLDLPLPKPLNVNIDKNYILSRGPIFADDLVVNADNRGIKNVVVWLRPDDMDRNSKIPANKIYPDFQVPTAHMHTVDHQYGLFVPRITLAREGDSIIFRNTSPVNIDVKLARERQDFAQVVGPGGDVIEGPLKAERTPIPFECNIHPWMKGQLRVFDQPYFAITNEDGQFEIPFVPVGRWRLVYAHENGYHKGAEGRFGFPIEVKGNGTRAVELPTVEYQFPKN